MSSVPGWWSSQHPAVAGLLGIGSACWRGSTAGQARVVAGVTADPRPRITVGYAAWLLPTGGTGLPSGLAAVAIGVSLAVVLTLAWSAFRSRQRGGPAPEAGDRTHSGGCRGPAGSRRRQRLGGGGRARSVRHSVPVCRGDDVHPRCLRPSALTAQPGRHRGGPGGACRPISWRRRRRPSQRHIYATGEEVLPRGGNGTIPAPSVATTRAMIEAGNFHGAHRGTERNGEHPLHR